MSANIWKGFSILNPQSLAYVNSWHCVRTATDTYMFCAHTMFIYSDSNESNYILQKSESVSPTLYNIGVLGFNNFICNKAAMLLLINRSLSHTYIHQKLICLPGLAGRSHNYHARGDWAHSGYRWQHQSHISLAPDPASSAQAPGTAAKTSPSKVWGEHEAERDSTNFWEGVGARHLRDAWSLGGSHPKLEWHGDRCRAGQLQECKIVRWETVASLKEGGRGLHKGSVSSFPRLVLGYSVSITECAWLVSVSCGDEADQTELNISHRGTWWKMVHCLLNLSGRWEEKKKRESYS